ncbi:acyl carrier protein [Micromonospora sp. WMMD1102]|uniref:acyl carrier protein n=1 Tax=Micromonospora sp. WMMD1102 TaxID=3016105 RepID=UPI00241514CD|nr:acyl carrier protein [Micromonospora sp. WMMD1102]MDG4786430.1 acyl carrier protein [Micromonospora sp. WMMD1102]
MSDQLTTGLDKEDLRKLIADTIDVDLAEVTDEAHFVNDLEVDSLMALEITVRLEKRYGVKMEESELIAVSTLDSTYQLLDGKLRGGS